MPRSDSVTVVSSDSAPSGNPVVRWTRVDLLKHRVVVRSMTVLYCCTVFRDGVHAELLAVISVIDQRLFGLSSSGASNKVSYQNQPNKLRTKQAFS